MNKALKEKFGITQDLLGVFFDPFAEMDDVFQKQEVEKHLSILWNFTQSKDDFKFRSIDDVLKDLDISQTKTVALRKENVKFGAKIVSSWICAL